MHRALPLLVAFCLFAGITLAQTDVSSSLAGIQVMAELQNSIAVNKAKVGDEVVLKLSEAAKQDGKLVISKGSKILGTVTAIEPGNGTTSSSSISIKFDRLEKDGVVTPILGFVASISSIDKKLRSLEADYERALIAAATISSPVNSLEDSIRQGRGNLNLQEGEFGNRLYYPRKAYDPGMPSNMPQTFSAVEEAARVSNRDIKFVSIDQLDNGVSLVSLAKGALKLEKWSVFRLVIKI